MELVSFNGGQPVEGVFKPVVWVDGLCFASSKQTVKNMAALSAAAWLAANRGFLRPTATGHKLCFLPVFGLTFNTPSKISKKIVMSMM